MDRDVSASAEACNDVVPSFDFSDETLERAAIADGGGITWGYCTHVWYCGWGL